MSPNLDEAYQHMGGNKASRKSKKRRKDLFQSTVNDRRELRVVKSQKEKFQRGEATCRADDVDEIIGCVCTSVSACMTHTMRLGSE